MHSDLDENKVVPYKFDDEEINQILAELHLKSTAMIIKCKKQLLFFKVLLVLSAFLLTSLFEYMLFISLWYMEPVFQFIMMFTPVLAGFIGWLVSNIIDRTFDLNHGLFHNGFQYAYENKHIYAFQGMLQEVRDTEKLWVNVIVGNYIWRVRNMTQNLKELEGKEVLLLLTRAFYDEDIDFECVLVRETVV